VLHHKFILKKKKKNPRKLTLFATEREDPKRQKKLCGHETSSLLPKNFAAQFHSNQSSDSRARQFIEYYAQSSTMIRIKIKGKEKI
jgi:hypothetical protein